MGIRDCIKNAQNMITGPGQSFNFHLPEILAIIDNFGFLWTSIVWVFVTALKMPKI